MLRAQYKCQEDDREYLVRQLVFLRKENQRLQNKLLEGASSAAAAAAEVEAARACSAAAQTSDSQQRESDEGRSTTGERYDVLVARLHKALEAERKRTRTLRSAAPGLAPCRPSKFTHHAFRLCVTRFAAVSGYIATAACCVRCSTYACWWSACKTVLQGSTTLHQSAYPVNGVAVVSPALSPRGGGVVWTAARST
jgi:hypothetical protein